MQVCIKHYVHICTYLQVSVSDYKEKYGRTPPGILASISSGYADKGERDGKENQTNKAKKNKSTHTRVCTHTHTRRHMTMFIPLHKGIGTHVNNCRKTS